MPGAVTDGRRAGVGRSAPVGEVTALEPPSWAHVSRPYRALDYVFRVRTEDSHLGRYLDDVFAAFPPPVGDAGEVATYSIIDRGSEVDFRFVLLCDGRHLVSSVDGTGPVAHLLWHINRRVVETNRRHLLVHASAAECHGAGLIFPAPMESGKTTLVAGLVRSGFRYLTDETVAINPASGLIDAYPRSLSVDSGSWQVLHDLAPQVPETVTPYLRDQWQVPPNSIRPGAVAPSTPPRLVITPRYRPGSQSRLVPVARSEALTILADNAFNFAGFGTAGLHVLARVVRGSHCYRLEIGDLEAACRLVADAVSLRRSAGD